MEQKLTMKNNQISAEINFNDHKYFITDFVPVAMPALQN